ncbi:uncharacterized protein K460DRAFT_363695 [Cucurbitaria berberidis CBS 394.84]|uniref:Uncharacterized protein n=1 Tax=Cucurbitaria berberidis CBS 394.84 TaxID=1168544 RepID=A0A9P4GLW8_9PLEO|nr:uncharacterized protein K460DRAFT_363695 [Cucurbitaria berberidis CBS 394.84]KAF1847632.1 hypothetical protein K460DRAFT_363695 [Cucurbitaria berberidis CBS 394.84]
MNHDIGAAYCTIAPNSRRLSLLVNSVRIKVGQCWTETGTHGLPWINATHPGGVNKFGLLKHMVIWAKLLFLLS